MSFVPYGTPAVVTLGVVAYGSTNRLAACVESLVTHASEVPFDIVCVLNPDQRDRNPDPSGLPPGIHAIMPDANLGWAGGMHVVRHASSSDWMGWIQDDSVLLPGWLDAQLAVATKDPRIGATGAVALDKQGRAAGYSGGYAAPGIPVALWNDSDPTADGDVPTAPAERDWLTSKGLLVRMVAWDDVGGPCARQYPLNHVDKEFSTHLRAHGWKLVVVPGANLTHMQSQSAPALFREFVGGWHEEAFDHRWEGVVRRLAVSEGAPVEHDCHRHPTIEVVERECLMEATRMVVPLGKYAQSRVETERTTVSEWLGHQWAREREELLAAQALTEADIHTRSAAHAQAQAEAIAHTQAEAQALADALAEAHAQAQSLAEAHAHAMEAMRASRSWRVTAPLRRAGSMVRRATGRRAR